MWEAGRSPQAAQQPIKAFAAQFLPVKLSSAFVSPKQLLLKWSIIDTVI
jgi:hypothetical protein